MLFNLLLLDYWTTGHGYGTATGFSGSSGGPGVLVVTNKP
jgi:hypothetical protein